LAKSCCVVLALGVFGMLASSTTAAEATPKRVLRHIVMYQFRPDLKPAELQEVIDTFAALPKKIDTIIGFERGVNVSQEGKSEGFTDTFVVTFRDEQGLKTYLDHPAHLAYVQIAKTRREKVIVFDYWTEVK